MSKTWNILEGLAEPWGSHPSLKQGVEAKKKHAWGKIKTIVRVLAADTGPRRELQRLE